MTKTPCAATKTNAAKINFLKIIKKILSAGNSLVVPWLGLHAFTMKGLGSIPDWGTKIPQAAQPNKIKFLVPNILQDFLGGLDGKASAYNEGDPGLIPGSGRSPEEGNGSPLQYLA